MSFCDGALFRKLEVVFGKQLKNVACYSKVETSLEEGES